MQLTDPPDVLTSAPRLALALSIDDDEVTIVRPAFSRVDATDGAIDVRDHVALPAPLDPDDDASATRPFTPCARRRGGSR